MSSESGYTGGASIVSEGSNQSFVMEVKTKSLQCYKIQLYIIRKKNWMTAYKKYKEFLKYKCKKGR